MSAGHGAVQQKATPTYLWEVLVVVCERVDGVVEDLLDQLLLRLLVEVQLRHLERVRLALPVMKHQPIHTTLSHKLPHGGGPRGTEVGRGWTDLLEKEKMMTGS